MIGHAKRHVARRSLAVAEVPAVQNDYRCCWPAETGSQVRPVIITCASLPLPLRRRCFWPVDGPPSGRCNPGADHPENVTPRSREPGAANYSSDTNGNLETDRASRGSLSLIS